MRYLAQRHGNDWHAKAAEYEQLHAQLQRVRVQADALRQMAHTLHAERRALKAERAQLERAKGEYFRKAMSAEAGQREQYLGERAKSEARLQAIEERLRAIRQQLRQLLAQRLQIGRTPELLAVRERVRQLEYEAELARITLTRNAILTSEGLPQTHARPTAWWFLLLSDAWFRANAQQTELYLEWLSEGRSK
jgi:chromosome segregation ATPase